MTGTTTTHIARQSIPLSRGGRAPAPSHRFSHRMTDTTTIGEIFQYSCRCCRRVTKLLDPTHLCSACWRHAFMPRHEDGTINCPDRAEG